MNAIELWVLPKVCYYRCAYCVRRRRLACVWAAALLIWTHWHCQNIWFNTSRSITLQPSRNYRLRFDCNSLDCRNEQSKSFAGFVFCSFHCEISIWKICAVTFTAKHILRRKLIPNWGVIKLMIYVYDKVDKILSSNNNNKRQPTSVSPVNCFRCSYSYSI